MVFQYFRDRAIEGPRDFFANDYVNKDGELRSLPSEKYAEAVRSLAPHSFEASLKWYASLGVLNQRDVQVAIKLVDYRNTIAHEPGRVIMGDGFRGWALGRARRLARKIDAFWIEVAVETDPDVPNDYDRGEAKSFFEIMLDVFDQAIPESLK
jgi:hypothetical protein